MLDLLFRSFCLFFFYLTNKSVSIFFPETLMFITNIAPNCTYKMHLDKAECSRGQPKNLFQSQIILTYLDVKLTLKDGRWRWFGENCSAFGGGWKTHFFWVNNLDFFFFKKINWLHSYLDQSQINEVAWKGLNFDDCPGFQLKITHAN